jgi:hypothetical protein
MIRGRNKRYKNAALRRKASIGPGGDVRLTRRTPISVVTTTPGDTTVIDFNQPIILSAPVGWTNNAGHGVLTQEQTGPDEVTVTFPAADTTTSVTIAFEDPGVRNGAGGYVLPGTFSGA